MTTDSRAHPFSADRPITSRGDDLLGRADFADSLANAIGSWKQRDSLIVALYGLWGSGKSSVKNMVLESLRGFKPSPLIVEFNPWEWAAQAQVSEAFFHEIEVVLGREDKSKHRRRRAAKWRAYAAYISVGSVFLSGIRNLVSALLAATAVLGIGASIFQSGAMRSVTATIGTVSLALAAVFKWGGKLADSWAATLSASVEARQRGLSEVKAELAGLLAELERPLVVVIDDVDRLTPDEIRLLFQLLKVNADFPNLVYLLLFQREVVEQSLGHARPVTGREFLEKIVQVGFDIPLIERPRMERVLFAGLDELLGDETVAKRFDQRRWGNTFIPGLRPYFETLRDVRRFVATFSFHVGLLRTGGSFEVNPIDLIALEVVRVFEPEVYRMIPDTKGVLTSTTDHASMGAARAEEQAKREVESILERAPEERRDAVREILRQLFPTVEWVFGGSHYGGEFMGEWFRELRVCHPDVFDRYFHFAIPEGDISQAELDRLLALAGDRAGLVSELRSLRERGLLAVALDRLEAYKERVDLNHAESFVAALFDIGDDLPDRPQSLFGMSPDIHAVRIVHWYLKQEQDRAKRAEVLKAAIRASSGIYLPAMKVSIEHDKKERQRDPEVFLVDESELDALRELSMDRIREAARDGRLSRHPKMAYILHRWHDWAGPDEPKAWVLEQIKSDEGLLTLLNAFVTPVVSHGLGDYVSRTTFKLNLQEIERFVALEVLENRAAGLSPEAFSGEAQRAVTALHRALKKRRDGKPSDARRVSEDDDDE